MLIMVAWNVTFKEQFDLFFLIKIHVILTELNTKWIRALLFLQGTRTDRQLSCPTFKLKSSCVGKWQSCRHFGRTLKITLCTMSSWEVMLKTFVVNGSQLLTRPIWAQYLRSSLKYSNFCVFKGQTLATKATLNWVVSKSYSVVGVGLINISWKYH